MIGYKEKNSPISSYQPSKEVIEITEQVKKDYDEGARILQKPWVELNDRSIIDDQNRGLKMFNAYVDTNIEDPNEAWKWRGTRSLARNRGVAMHAQLTSIFLLPLFTAQNENDEVDRDFSEVMREIIEWMAQPCNSNYQSSFLQVTMGMMTNPVTYLGAEFREVYQKIKEKQEDGKYKTKEVIDSVLSGFKAPVWSSNQILITNAYERNIQKQRAIIQRRYAEYKELEAIYGEHPNWVYVQEGVKSIYSYQDGLFYDIKDDDHPHLVAEEIWKCRREDLEIPFINGIYMGDSDVNANPIRHRDNFDTPKYNVIPFGYSRIGEHFFYYKSMMNVLSWDNMAYDAMSEIVYNRALLENEMPLAVSGSDKVDSNIIFPNAVIPFEDKDTKISPLLPASNIMAGFNVLRETEKSISENSVNEVMSGQLPDSSQKAYNVAQAQANAKKNLSGVMHSLAESMIGYGDLMKDIAINNITVPQIEELVGGKMKMKYKTFLLENKKNGSKMGDKIIRFDESLIGNEMTDEEKLSRSFKLLEETDYPKDTKSIRLVNPSKFAKYYYLTKIDIGEMMTKTDEYMQPLLLALKNQFAQDPFVDQETLTRKVMYAYFNSEGEELMKEEQIPGLPEQVQEGQAGGKIANQIFNKSASTAVNNKVL